MDTQPPVISYQSPVPTEPSRRGKGFLALSATIFLPGAGQMLAGHLKRGAVILLTFLLLNAASIVALIIPSFFPSLLLLVPVIVLFSIAAWIDAYRMGHRATWNMLGRPLWRYLAGTGIFVVAFAANPGKLFGLYIHYHLVESFSVAGVSMAPTVDTGDHFLVRVHATPHRWSIITFIPPGRPSVFVQRVIGLPGEKVEILDGKVIINGVIVPPPAGIGPYLPPPGPARPMNNGLTLAADEYFVLGDNSTRSLDSRYFTTAAPDHQLGAVPAADIRGTATWIYWPPSHWKRLDAP